MLSSRGMSRVTLVYQRRSHGVEAIIVLRTPLVPLNALLLCHACSGQTGSLDVALHRLHRLDAMNRFVVKRDLAPEQEGHCVVRWCCSCSSESMWRKGE